MSNIYLHYREYEAALYNTYLLMQDNPGSLFLQKCIAKSLYGLSKYANSERYSEAHEDYIDKQGKSQQLYYIFYKIKPSELNVLAVEYLYNLKKQYPGDKEIAAMTEDIFNELPDYYPDKSFFSTTPRPASFDSLIAADTITTVQNDDKEKNINIDKGAHKKIIVKTKSKYENSDGIEKNKEKITENQDKNSSFKYAFVDLMKDPAFISDYEKSVKVYKERQADIDYEETDEYKKALAKQERREKRKGVALGLEKLIIVNPFYYKIDESHTDNPVKLVASETAQKDLDNKIKSNASLAGLNYQLIDMKDLTANSSDLFNDLSVLNNYVTELNQLDGMHYVNYMTDDVQALVKKYGTGNFSWTGVMCFREHKDFQTAYSNTVCACFSILYFPLTPYAIYNAVKTHYKTYIVSYVYDLKNGEPVNDFSTKIKFIDRPDVINSVLYDLYLQYKKTKKS
jgi:hypothetical protein